MQTKKLIKKIKNYKQSIYWANCHKRKIRKMILTTYQEFQKTFGDSCYHDVFNLSFGGSILSLVESMYQEIIQFELKLKQTSQSTINN